MRFVFGNWALAQAMLVACALCVSATSATAASGYGLSRPQTNTRPAILTSSDQSLYSRIAGAQARGDFKTADALIAQLNDKRLMGYVLSQRYLGRHYTSSYGELADWMARYSDQPNAKDIYDLALRKNPGGASGLRPPEPRRRQGKSYSAYTVTGSTPTDLFSDAFRSSDAYVKKLVGKDRNTQALRYIESERVTRRLTTAEIDAIRSRIAGGFFYDGDDRKALEIAKPASDRNSAMAPLANWYGGMAAYRLGQYDVSAQLFERLARARSVTDWTRAGAGFWAARANVAAHRPERVAPMLEVAANTGATFYGLLATRQLGRDPRFTWIEPTLSAAGFQLLMTDPGVARAVALSQVPAYQDEVKREIIWASGRIDPSLDQALIALTDALGFPDVQLQIASGTYIPPTSTTGGALVMNSGLFPVPPYGPNEGYKVDRAFLLAIARQESRFKEQAVSHAGARGLMQIMPGTAKHIKDRNPVPYYGLSGLFDPALSLTYGQAYLKELMDYTDPYANYFMMATAYNAGPGNLRKWLERVDHRNDPILFVEAIPASETRGYIERVMTNLWIYRDRLGQPAPSLDEAAAGLWPVYRSQEGHLPSVAAKQTGAFSPYSSLR